SKYTNIQLDVNEYEEKLASLKNVQLVDVRTAEEYAEGHLKNAVNINIGSSNFEEHIAILDKNKPVMVYCLSGGRSGNAANKLEKMGFTQVYNMKGGIMKWRNAG